MLNCNFWHSVGQQMFLGLIPWAGGLRGVGVAVNLTAVVLPRRAFEGHEEVIVGHHVLLHTLQVAPHLDLEDKKAF